MTDYSVTEMLNGTLDPTSSAQWLSWVENAYDLDEDLYVNELLDASSRFSGIEDRVRQQATTLVQTVREQSGFAHAVDKLLQEYSLNNEEGVILMCLAEALMRVPDAHTADKLIANKISPAKWESHLGQSDSLFVNASTWGLMLTGKITGFPDTTSSVSRALRRLLNTTSEPVIRAAMYRAMSIMGKQFVLGRTIDEAVKNGKPYRDKGYAYSFDMLGEAALTDADAQRYFEDYQRAIHTLGSASKEWPDVTAVPSVSIKLSALHPRYESTKETQVLNELSQRLLALAVAAREQGIGLTIDAEEADRLELSLKLFQRVLSDPQLAGWGEFGLVVQAYAKPALPVLGFIGALAREHDIPIPVRLVKGAYWDSEIKWAQQKGQPDYPVFTRKENSDLSFLVCADYLMSQQLIGCIYPQFATHNAQTIAFIETLAEQRQVKRYEFQRLHGMGDALYDQVIGDAHAVRIYAPVGAHKDLLPYLVRRLLENGANSSFVHRLVDARTPIDDLVHSPVDVVSAHQQHRSTVIPKPADLYGPARRNSRGHNLFVASSLQPLQAALTPFRSQRWQAIPAVTTDRCVTVYCPSEAGREVGEVHWCSPAGARQALEQADKAFDSWRQSDVTARAKALRTMADLLETHEAEMITLCQLEAGKTLQDSIDEVREAVDFLRYYSLEGERLFAQPTRLPGPTGETNEHYFEGRGVFVCISPWNFPLAIFLGQISAALMAGNTVLAKPAEATSLIASRAVALFHEAGIPREVLWYVSGSGAVIGQALLGDDRVSGVAFTGSTATAKSINRQLAERDGAIATLIAETGGNNAMIVDSTALPEQVVHDTLQSAFASAGQRCSALRVLCLQEDIADHIIELIRGALARWQVGDPCELATDSGPVIDDRAYQKLSAYVDHWRQQGAVLAEAALPEDTRGGHFLAPALIEIDSLSRLGEEQFGPILHVYRYPARALDTLIDDINGLGYGLTLGVHSRNEQTAAYIERKVRVGNCYINRNQIGAVVGVQPFGGRGLSGTGPKAGGPNYLQRFATERTRTINTTAVGGNASLLAEQES